MKNNTAWGLPLLYIIALGLCFTGYSQSIQRQYIGPLGSYGNVDMVRFQQSIGQSYATSAFYDSTIGIRPGFQQPSGYIQKSLLPAFSKLVFYPNPVRQHLRVSSTSELTNVHIRVVDITGKLIFQEAIPHMKEHVISCEIWNPGLYLISLNSSESYKHFKLIKN